MADSKDFQILEELEKNSRASIKEIARKTRLPRTTVFDRLKKMEKEKLIQKYTVQPDYAKLGKPATAFILVKYAPLKEIPQKTVAQKIAKLSPVFEVHMISGEWDILVKVRAKDLKEIGELVIEKIRAIEGVSATLSCASFSSVKE